MFLVPIALNHFDPLETRLLKTCLKPPTTLYYWQGLTNNSKRDTSIICKSLLFQCWIHLQIFFLYLLVLFDMLCPKFNLETTLTSKLFKSLLLQNIVAWMKFFINCTIFEYKERYKLINISNMDFDKRDQLRTSLYKYAFSILMMFLALLLITFTVTPMIVFSTILSRIRAYLK